MLDETLFENCRNEILFRLPYLPTCILCSPTTLLPPGGSGSGLRTPPLQTEEEEGEESTALVAGKEEEAVIHGHSRGSVAQEKKRTFSFSRDKFCLRKKIVELVAKIEDSSNGTLLTCGDSRQVK